MKLIIVADIHGNIIALESVLKDAVTHYGSSLSYVHMGDAINYGMRPNETIKQVRKLDDAGQLIVNIAGNHEQAALGKEADRFSTTRGKQALEYTKSTLTPESLDFITHSMRHGPQEKLIDERPFLFVHGTLSDLFWGAMGPDDLENEMYKKYDFVISGHTHLPFYHEAFFTDDSSQARRGKKRVVFINAGSVGQPRNHNPHAQYVMLDTATETTHFNRVAYDIEKVMEQYDENMHPFYKERLQLGV